MRILTILTSLSALVFATDKSELILDIEKSLMASCFHGTVYEHGNAEMEKEIAAFVAKGKDKNISLITTLTNMGSVSLQCQKQKGLIFLLGWLLSLFAC